MSETASSRRTFLALGAAALTVGAEALRSAQAQQPATQPLPQKGRFPVRVISSSNGLEAARLAYQRLVAGDDTLDAVIAGVNLVEDDPNDTSVGYGGLPNEAGDVELDAAVMHGPTHRGGAVAALRGVRYPSKVAKLVMEQTDHVLLVGLGAQQFAKAHGFKQEDLLTEKARKIWLHWKQTHSDNDDWLPPPREDVDPDVAAFFGKQATADFGRPTGTIHTAAINADGEISCVTTTSGLAFKIPGRVGDSPILGAGLYCDNAIGSCRSTGAI